ncbi:hypothetical protein [Marasmitruncus massiliensis]|uniref:hypothetical protein n=1 Tax=Marasmitruncus massiliensis TaxID=1944642 RepID=UPI000C7DB9B5|nr:hypothetical protein [Marasmitruncus massiliensis]
MNDELCPRCGEHPIAEGNTLCTSCRREIGPDGFIPHYNTACPVCGAELQFAVNCKKHRALVCLSHCYTCAYIDEQTSITRCDFLRKKVHEKTV